MVSPKKIPPRCGNGLNPISVRLVLSMNLATFLLLFRPLAPWWDTTCRQKILMGYKYRNNPFHFGAVNLNFWWGNMLCERESAKACWKISFQPLKIPLKDKKWVSSVGLRKRHLWCQNSNSNLHVGISNKLLPTI